MNKFKVVSDPNAKSNGSTRFIVDSINAAAHKLDLYSDNDYIICYDTICQQYDYNPHILFCAMEIPFPRIALENAGGKPIIGLSRTNGLLPAYGGYPLHLCNYVTLGVDSKKWNVVQKTKNLDKFVFYAISESTVRSGFEILIEAFGESFKGNNSVVLYLRDRGATPIFKNWVRKKAAFYKVNIVHDDRDISDHTQILDILSGVDVGVCVNRGHTFALQVVETMSCGIPCILMNANGLADYALPGFNCWGVNFDMEDLTQEKLIELENIGLKNYLFQINSNNYINQPFWARPNIDSLIKSMSEAFSDRHKRYVYGAMGRLTAEQLTWERTCFNISAMINDFKNKGVL
jgi:glycosyltransferase involved in cell wall biosynthesis